MIRFRKRKAPPEYLPEEAKIVDLSDDGDQGYAVIADDIGRVYRISFPQLLEYYEVE